MDHDLSESWGYFSRNGVVRSITPDQELERILGLYYSVRLHISGEFLNLNPVWIQPGGLFLMKSTKDPDNEKKRYHGIASILNKHTLVLKTHHFGQDIHDASSYYHIQNFSSRDKDHFQGLGLSVTDEGPGLAARECLIPYHPEINEAIQGVYTEMVYAGKVKDTFQKMESLRVPLFPKNSPKNLFEIWNSKLNGKLQLLVGPRNNLLRWTEQTGHSEAEILAAAACFMKARGKETEALGLFEKAFRHGLKLDDFPYIRDEMKDNNSLF